MRVHLGSGKYYWPGYTNIDIAGRFDIESDVTELPLENEQADEIHAIHLFEHLHRYKVSEILTEWKRVLKTGGKLVLEMPCFDKVAQFISEGSKDFRMTHYALFGDPHYKRPEMEHKWCYSMEELRWILSEAGFTNIEFKTPAFHIEQRDMRVECTK